jgi:hypothetical protein
VWGLFTVGAYMCLAHVQLIPSLAPVAHCFPVLEALFILGLPAISVSFHVLLLQLTRGL